MSDGKYAAETTTIKAITTTPKWKSVGFWVGIIGVAILATGVSPESLTSWGAVWELIKDTVTNPFALVGVAMAVYSAWNNPTTKGVN